MAATITGVVYNDLNHNGQYDAGEPGLANVAVVLYNASAGCTEVRTGADGSFSLTRCQLPQAHIRSMSR